MALAEKGRFSGMGVKWQGYLPNATAAPQLALSSPSIKNKEYKI